MPDIANLGIKIDASDADNAAVKLDKLAAAGARAEVASGKLGSSHRRMNDEMGNAARAYIEGEKGLSATRKGMLDVAGAADIMATRQAGALNKIGQEAHVSSRAVNEMIVLTRELSRGNFTRMAGSSTILAQSLQSTNSSLGDVFRAFGLMLGVIERVPPAMAAATASEIALSDAAVLVMESEAGSAAAALASAEARVAAAERVFAGNEAVARSEKEQLAAAIGLIAANEELAGAATAAAIAEERLALAEGNAAAAAGVATGATAELGAATAVAGASAAEAGVAAEFVVSGFAIAALTIGVFVVALAAMAVAIVSGQNDLAQLSNTLEVTNNYAGLTADSFRKMNEDIAQKSGTSVSAIERIGTTYLQTGEYGRKAIEDMIFATQRFADLTGEDGNKVAQEWAKMADNPAKFAESLSRVYDVIDIKTFKHIDALQKQGRMDEAVSLTAKALAGDLATMSVNVGDTAGWWDQLTTSISNAWHALKQWGAQSATQKVQDVIGSEENIQANILRNARWWGKSKADEANYAASLKREESAKAYLAKLEAKPAADAKPAHDKKSFFDHYDDTQNQHKKRAKKATDPVSSERSFLESLNQETATMGFNKVEQKLHEVNDRANEAAKSGFGALAAAILKAGAAWEKAFPQHAVDELTKKIHEENDAQMFATGLLRLDAKERAIANVHRKYELELLALKKQGIDLTTAALAELNTEEKIAVQLAAEQGDKDLAVQRVRDYANSVHDLTDGLRQATAGFGDLFGTAGRGFENLINSATGYADAQADLLVKINDTKDQTAQGDAARASAARAYAQNQVALYGNMLGAAKTFFAQGSAGYKILEAAERAYRIYQLFAMIQSISMKKVETATALSSDATTTASSVVASTTKAGASVIAGAAKMFEHLGPFGFIAVAGMLALMVGLGFKGGGGGGAAASATSPTDTSNITSDAYNSPYSTQPGKNGLYDPSNASLPASRQYGQNGGQIIAPVYNITAPGADAGTVQQIQGILDSHTAQTVTLARQASAQDAAALASRQRIGGA